jgi:hypothetical protein
LALLLTVWKRNPTIPVPMPTPDDKELRISIRVPRAMYDQIKKAAARDHRTMAGWVKALIANALDAEGGASTRKR